MKPQNPRIKRTPGRKKGEAWAEPNSPVKYVCPYCKQTFRLKASLDAHYCYPLFSKFNGSRRSRKHV